MSETQHTFGEDETCRDAHTRVFLPENFHHGSKRNECPVCKQNVALRRRRLNAGMAATICWLVREWWRTTDWINVQAVAPRFVLRAREVSRLPDWGLAEAKPNADDPSRRMSGLWRPTKAGMAFVLGGTFEPTHAFTYNGKCYGHEDARFDIHAALDGGPFDYGELMAQTPGDVARTE